jgi:hypothetical protein
MAKNKKNSLVILILFVIVLGIFATQVGFYTIQPIGAIPDGTTWLILRSQGEPYFNSPDAFCLERTGEVSLLGRAMAMQQAPNDKIILKLPYMKFAYLKSTGGKDFTQ